MPVSCVCSPSVRKTELSPVFVNLLKDQSRWVRMTAYQALGPFISTFADSNITTLLHNDNGEIVITDRELLAQRLEDLEQARAEEQEQEQEKAEQAEGAAEKADGSGQLEDEKEPSLSEQVCDDPEAETTKKESEEEEADSVIHMDIDTDDTDDTDKDKTDDEHLGTSSRIVHSKSLGDLSLEEDRANNYNSSKLTSSESFNNFLYWRDPLPVLDDLPTEQETEKTSDDKEPTEDDRTEKGTWFLEQLTLKASLMDCTVFFSFLSFDFFLLYTTSFWTRRSITM